jgi:hypothetical protein
MSRRWVLVLAIVVVAAFCAAAGDRQMVLVAARRGGWIEFISVETLQTLNRLQVGVLAEGVSATPDGQTLFVTKAVPPDLKLCCGLYAIDLAKTAMSLLLEPALLGVTSAKGDRMFTQKDNSGIEVFDARTLAPMPTIKAGAIYILHPSPDGRWLFGVSDDGDRITQSEIEGPTLHIFDLQSNQLVRRIRIPYDLPTGIWLGDKFYLFAFDGRQAHLWPLSANSTSLGAGSLVSLPGLVRDPKPIIMQVLGANGHLFVFEVFGHRVDRRPNSDRPLPGGVYEIDPAGAAVSVRLAANLHFARLVAAPDGETLYGFDVDSPNGKNPPRLVKIDRKSGRIAAERALDRDLWNMQIAEIPTGFLNRGEVRLSNR